MGEEEMGEREEYIRKEKKDTITEMEN